MSGVGRPRRRRRRAAGPRSPATGSPLVPGRSSSERVGQEDVQRLGRCRCRRAPGCPKRSAEAALQVGGQRLAGGDRRPAPRRTPSAGDVGVEQGGDEAGTGEEQRRLLGCDELERRPAGVGRRGFEDRRGARRRAGTSASCRARRRRTAWPPTGSGRRASTPSTVAGVRLGGRLQAAVAVHHALRQAGRARAVQPERRRVGRRSARPGASHASANVGPARATATRERRRPRRRSTTACATVGAAATIGATCAGVLGRHDDGAGAGVGDDRGEVGRVSIVDSGTGTTPERSAPRNQAGNAGSSLTTRTTRSPAPTPSARARAGPATPRRCSVGVGQSTSPPQRIATRSPPPAVDVAVEQPARLRCSPPSVPPQILTYSKSTGLAWMPGRRRRDPAGHLARLVHADHQRLDVRRVVGRRQPRRRPPPPTRPR